MNNTTLPVTDVMKLVIENMKKTGNPVGLRSDRCIYWIKDLDVPRGGRSILYTSCMYQMAPYIKTLVTQLERSEQIGFSGALMRLGSVFAKYIDIYAVIKPPSSEIDRSSRIIRNIYTVLRKIEPSIGYLYEDEPYSGALLYELGLEDYFIDHAKKVVEVFRRYGVKRIITIDPHTHHVLKNVYPSYINDFDFEVVHYLEILSNRLEVLNQVDIKDEYTIHDPCLLTRYSGIIDQPRMILDKVGVKYKDHLRSKIRTRCCGGPIESLAPSITGLMARYRLEELSNISNNVIVMCPICYVALSRVSEKYNAVIKDIAEFLG